jgi:hypothetical protein
MKNYNVCSLCGNEVLGSFNQSLFGNVCDKCKNAVKETNLNGK